LGSIRLDFMEPLGISATALAKRAGVPTNRITAILHGERSITPVTALFLTDEFRTTPEFWMNLQTAHDLDLARGRRLVAA
jgi:addiction module HigA family antidote